MSRQMSREEKFFRMCTVLPFEEIKDPRDEYSIPELRRIAELRDTGQMQGAIDYGRSLMLMYPDNDLIPFMLAYIYYQQQFPEEALQMAIEAIPKCPRKYRLYSVAGLAEFSRDRLPEALVWWSRSVVAQCAVTDFQENDPFLYVGHTAMLLGFKREAQNLFSMSDAIEPGGRRLDPDTVEKLERIKDSWARKPFVDVLHHIDRNLMHGG